MNNMKTIKRFLALLLFFVAAMNVQNLSAQTNGDVNNDGSVNEADISAIIEIMKEANGVGPKKYYWYAGQVSPESNSTITSTVGAEGWRLIGNPDTVSKSNPLFDTTTSSEEAIVGTKSDYWYIALPADKSYKIYDSDYADQIAAGNFEKQSSTVSFNNVNYTVYKGVGTARKWWGYTIY